MFEKVYYVLTMQSVTRILSIVLSNLCFFCINGECDNALRAGQVNIRILPSQVHLSFGDDISKMVVTWSTIDRTNTSIVRYGSGSLKIAHLGKITKFSNGPGHVQYIHVAQMDKLTPNTPYEYQVGSGNPKEMSSIFTFKSLPGENNWSPRFCIYGDMGLLNARSWPRISADVAKEMYDAILHVGDFAYNLDSNFGDIGDRFMKMIEPVATRIPYMTTPGNHENAGNFSNYKNRFSMPNNNNENLFYSYNVGPVHIISINTEFYICVYYGLAQILNQYDWLIQDLKTANLAENRAKRPWILFVGHRPIYCTNNDSIDCSVTAKLLRYGIPWLHILGLEDLLFKYGVDIAIWAHEHSYERMWPVYNEKVVNSSTPGQPYKNPKSTVHIVSGSAGCDENHDTFPRSEKPYSAFHSMDYGYSRVTIHNKTHLYFEQVSDDQKGKIIDSIWLIREHHEPFYN